MATYTNAELVAQLYIGFYDRAPDPDGLNYWIGRLNAGVSISDIADSFAASPEAAETYPYIRAPNLFTPDQFLDNVYQNIFGRPIDADGLAYYKARIDSGESLGSVVSSIIGNATTNPNNDDGLFVANKVAAGLNWAEEAANHPNVDIYQENGRLTGAADNSAHGVINGVNADPATVDVAKAEAADFFRFNHIDLTKEVDNLVGTTGDDMFHATAGPLGLSLLDVTLNNGDRIDGGGGDNDTLQVIATLPSIMVPVTPILSNLENIDVQTSIAGGVLGGFAMDLSQSTGVKQVSLSNSSSVGMGTPTATFMNVGNLVNAAINNVHQGELNISYRPSVTLGANDTQNVAITNSSAEFNVDTGVENLVVTTTGSDPIYEENELCTSIYGLKTVTISGDGPLYISFDKNADLTTVDASGTTGGVYVDDLDNGKAITVTGGSGDDIFLFYDGLTAGDKVNGGAGFDTVGVDAGDYSSVNAAKALNALVSIEQIEFYGNGAGTIINHATLTNPDVEAIRFNDNTFELVKNARSDIDYSFRDDNGNAQFDMKAGSTDLNIELAGTKGYSYVSGDGDAASVGNIVVNLTGVPLTAVSTINIVSSGDLAAGDANETGWIVARGGSTINITGNAALDVQGLVNHAIVDASALEGNLTILGSQANTLLRDGDVMMLGSGHNVVEIDTGGSGYYTGVTLIHVDEIQNFHAGAGGDLIDYIGAGNPAAAYHVLTAGTQTTIDSLGAGSTLYQATNLAMGELGAAWTGWTAFSYEGETYAVYSNGAGGPNFNHADDLLVHLVGVDTADLSQANFA